MYRCADTLETKNAGKRDWIHSARRYAMSEVLSGIVERFRLEGLTVSVVKHASDGFDLDQPGKDSFRLPTPSHAAAGIARATERRNVIYWPT